MKIIINKLFLFLLISIALISIGLDLSIRNGEKIAEKAPEFMDNHDFKLIQYHDFKPHIIYGRVVEYHTTYDDISTDTFIVALTMISDSIVVYNIAKQKREE